MKRPSHVKEIEFSTTLDEFREFIKNSKEKTSTSPSGRHYGHYKALHKADPKFLATIHSIIEISLQHNIILNRWRSTVTTLIEKDTGTPFIHRMRAIHIIEAEVQFLAKNLYVTKLLRNAEQQNLLTDEQYGGRSRRQAQSAVLNKVLYYNLSRQMLLPAAFMDDDARACYDRIVTSLNSLECRKWGAPYKLAKFTNTFIENQAYSIRTAHGISNSTYSYSDDAPIQGSGQGIGWAGPRWLCSGDTCSRILAESKSGMSFSDPTYSIKVRKQGDYFVDDTATGVTLNTLRADQRDIFEQLQDIEQLHSDVLFSLGHKLAIDKCSFYAADYIRGKIQHEHKLIHELPGTVHIREGHTSHPTNVKRLQPFQAHKTLGCHIALDSNQKRQFIVLNDKLKTWNSKIVSSFLNKKDRIKSYEAYMAKSGQYILSTSSLSKKQCHELDKNVTPILYNAHGVQRNSSKCMLYSPVQYGGYGHHDFWSTQGIEKLKFFLTHYRRHDTTGRLLKMSMRWTQLECGLSTPFYTSNFEKYNYVLTPTWVTHLWEYLDSCQAAIEEKNSWIYEAPRENDIFLMDVIMNAPISNEHKMIFNEIRLHLKLITASDIVTLDTGCTILPHILQGHNYRGSTLYWPDTKPFPNKWLKIWKSLLTSYILPKLMTKPLGQWLTSTHQTWSTWCTTNRDFIFVKDAWYYKHTHTRRATYLPTAQIKTKDQPADISKKNNTIVLLGTSTINSNLKNPEPSTTAWDHFNNAPAWQREIWGTAPITEAVITEIQTQLQQNNINAAGDGSVKGGKGAHAWCIFRKDNHKILIKGAAVVRGDPMHMTSLRTETVSSIAAGSFLNMVAQPLPHLDASVVFYSDSESTVINSQRPLLHNIGTVLENDIDVTIQNVRLTKKSLFNYSLAHIHGHQDDKHKKTELSPIAKINVEMDKIAGEFIDQLNKNTDHSEPLFFPTQQVTLKIGGRRIATNIIDNLVFEYNKEKIFQHYENVIKVPKEAMPFIQWRGLKFALRDRKNKDPTLKAMHNQWQTMRVCHRWKLSENSLCTLCTQHDETWDHVLKCGNIHLTRLRQEQITKIKSALVELKTNAVVQTHILLIINSWLSNIPITLPPVTTEFPSILLRRAYEEQVDIGISGFFKGIISTKWGDIQETDYYRLHRNSTFNRIRWEKKLITILQNFSTSMWSERCDIIHAANEDTNDIRYRQRMWKYCQDINETPWKLKSDSIHLLDRNENFFQTGPMINIQAWYDNVITAIDHCSRPQNSVYGDIRNFFRRNNETIGVRSTVTRISQAAASAVVSTKNKIQSKIFNFSFSRPSLG